MTKANTPAEAKSPAKLIADLGLNSNTKPAAPEKVRKSAGNAGVTNERLLPWPQDVHGMCQGLRREGARAIGRMNGDPARLKLLLDTIAVLTEYAHDKLKWQAGQKVAFEDRRAATVEAKLKATVAAKRAALAAARKEARAAEIKAAGIEAEIEGIA